MEISSQLGCFASPYWLDTILGRLAWGKYQDGEAMRMELASGPSSHGVQGMTARGSPLGAHALLRKSGKPCRGRPGIFKSVPVVCNTLTLLYGAPPGMPWP